MKYYCYIKDNKVELVSTSPLVNHEGDSDQDIDRFDSVIEWDDEGVYAAPDSELDSDGKIVPLTGEQLMEKQGL